MAKFDVLEPESFSPGAAQQAMLLCLPWLDEFCHQHGFVRKDGRSNFARALNLLSGHRPKTKKEWEFLAALLDEVERRFPGAMYPEAFIRRRKSASTSGRPH